MKHLNGYPPFRHFKHSLYMIRRNQLVYIKLSITILISFSLLYGFLLFTDSRLYNQYKEIFAQPSELVLSNIYEKPAAYKALLSQIKNNIPNADCYGYITTNGVCEYENGRINVRSVFLPSGDIPVYTWEQLDYEESGAIYSVAPIELLGEKQDFNLKENEVIINESWYQALVNGRGSEPIRIRVNFDWQEEDSEWELKVVGMYKDTLQEGVGIDETGFVNGFGGMYISAALFSGLDIGRADLATEYSVWVNTSEHESVLAYASALGFSSYGVSEAQREANAVLKVEKANKAYVAAVIFVLLSINLYSSFSNALKDRCYEIGVKRALGASKGDIVRQFLYESLCVMLFDTLVAVMLVFDLVIGYKAFQIFVIGKEWTIFISPYSIITFSVCSLSLSVVFSLLFAFKSTQVEIISNLREE